MYKFIQGQFHDFIVDAEGVKYKVSEESATIIINILHRHYKELQCALGYTMKDEWNRE